MKTVSTTKAPAAIGPYSQAQIVGNMVYTSGQVGIIPETGEVAVGVEAQAHQVFKNLSELLKAAGSDMSKVVKTTVFNTGDPIPEEDLDKVWVKFFKVDKARTREYGGSGIGLSIVKAIMDSFQQQCGCQNYDNGVAFWFTLEADGKTEEA